MDWKQILSLSKEELSDERQEEIYNELIKDQKFDGKIAKKVFPLCLAVLKFKGSQVEKQREQIELLASSDIDLKSTLEQVERQKKQITKLEAEKIQFKARIKELTEEMAMQASNRDVPGSDEDSPDQMSEIEKQQELFAKMNMKNKHIGRLLKDIEILQEQNTTYVNAIKQLRAEVEETNGKFDIMNAQHAEMQTSVAFLEDQISNLNSELHEKEDVNRQLIREKAEGIKEMEEFSKLVEQRTLIYKSMVDEKQRDLELANQKYQNLIEQLPAGFDVDSEQSEIRRLVESLSERDELIKEFEEKISQLSKELIDSTELIKKISRERDEYQKRLTQEKRDKCCEEIQTMLERSNVRCQELQEMLENVENDNQLKAKQAFEAIEALRSYENKTDGLADALKKIHQLQENCHQKESQIHELVVELNSQNEVVAENAILRRRCGIPDDEIIETKAFLAKQKRSDKIIERLNLKLRASEEMRLQLKIDKNDLRRQILQLQNSGDDKTQRRVSISSNEEQRTMTLNPVEHKTCENCHNTYNVYDSVKFCKSCIMKRNSNLCDSCVSKFRLSNDENIELLKKLTKLEIDHRAVIEENENLRVGLSEIFEKIHRDNEENSNHDRTIINPAILEKLITILRIRTTNADHEIPPPKDSSGGGDENVIDPPQNLNSFAAAAEETQKLKELVKHLSDKNEEVTASLEHMRIVERNYEELVRSSELSDDDKTQLLMKSLQRCHEFEAHLQVYERKIEFLGCENDILCNELRNIKTTSMEVIHELRMEIIEKSHGLGEIERDEEKVMENSTEIDELQNELHVIRSKLSGVCLDILKNAKITRDDNSDEKIIIENVSVIENNFTATFITRQELESMKRKISLLEETIKKKQVKECQLDDVLKVMNSQLKSQQLLLSQFSDDEISARHLIVDLQSKSNENYMLAKTTKELRLARDQCDNMRVEMERMNEEIEFLKGKLVKTSEDFKAQEMELKEKESQNKLKLQYLQKTLTQFCHQYSSMTPIYLIADFIKDYIVVMEMKKQLEDDRNKFHSQSTPPMSSENILEMLKKDTTVTHKITDIEARIAIVKHKSSCEYLKQQLELRESTIREMHDEISRAKMNEIKNRQHWNAIKLLFNPTENPESKSSTSSPRKILTCDKQVQVGTKLQDIGVNTDEISSTTIAASSEIRTAEVDEKIIQTHSPVKSAVVVEENEDQEPLKSQLKKALMLAQSRSVLLIETENRLSEAHGRIKALEKSIENREKQHQKEKDDLMATQSTSKSEENSTISTLQNLILERDTTLSKYQNLLKSERQQHSKSSDELADEIKNLKKSIGSWEMSVNEKEEEIGRLKKKIKELQEKIENKSPPSKPSSPTRHVTFQQNDDDSDKILIRELESKMRELQNQNKQMEQQLRDLINTERQLQSSVRDKEICIKDLSAKLKVSQDNYNALSVNFTSNEIDALRDMLEEKDRHIQDLTETLNQFHDDQQKYINDSAINSAEQVNLISSDLNRADASNRVLKTQLEALKRQLANVQTREKTTRELNKTLKNQLIRRPVIAVNNKRASTVVEDNYQNRQRRIRELEIELDETRKELRKQTNIVENKRAKNAAELGLWEKQKRYQEMAEKLKCKLTDSELECERLKANLQMAKNTVTKLEKEKAALENKSKSDRYRQNVAIAQKSTQQLCMQCQKHANGTESGSSDFGSEMTNEIIETLRARIASQQRKIIAYEFDGKGTNSMAHEIEKLQEQMSAVESQNIRLEARNVQLQLDLDMWRQNDSKEKQESRIQHLEGYILVLKEELATAHAKTCEVSAKQCKHDHSKINDSQQAILSLKRLVDKLKAENKHLKDAKGGSSTIPSTSTYMSQNDRKKEEIYNKLKSDYEKLRKTHNDFLVKYSEMEVELQMIQSASINYSCPHCNKKNPCETDVTDVEELRRKLQIKGALLQKAKTLLSQTAAKEKQCRQHIYELKKRICELEGVPVISEENSDASQI